MAVRASDVATHQVVEAIASEVIERLSAAGARNSSGGDPHEGLLTLDEAAGRARCSTRTLRRAVQSGRLRASQPAGRGGKLLIDVGDLDRWLFGRSGRSSAEGARVRRKRANEPRGTPRRISIAELQSRRSA
jgi:excisionase family DNA binding protein